MIGRTISHYKITEELGRGGMGVVYKALDTKLQRHVAIKVLPAHLSADEEAKTRFTREARAASALEHPNICHIHEIGETDDGHLFMVMPCYEGETLGERLERGPLEVGEALDITSQIASALSRAHEKGIIHRDIKPGNVMLTDGGRQAKLMDFGLAKRLDATKMTRTGTTLGTVAYMSPEQAMGKETDHRADIWALGVVLYEMLSGRQPFRGEYEPAVLYSIMNEEPEPVTSISKEVPPGVERIVERALAKDVEKRYETTAGLLADIEQERDRIELGVKERRFIKLRRKTRNRLLRIGLPSVLVAAAVFVLLVVQPFELEISTKTKEAIARENSLMVLKFENIADPADEGQVGRIAKYLLANGLDESEYIQVLGEWQEYDILKELGKEDPHVLDRSSVREVAERTNSNWVVSPKILRLEPTIVMTAEITNARTGEPRGTQSVQGDIGEDLLAVVDKLKRAIREDLALPDKADEEIDRSLGEITTSSQNALRYYLEGMDYLYKYYDAEAAASFEKSLEYDSTFAMAYLRLSSCVSERLKKKEMIEKALQFSARATTKERMYIESRHAWFVRDIEGAVRGYESIIRAFPGEFEAYFYLGSLYMAMGNRESGIENLEKAIEINPLYKLAYSSLAFFYRASGDIEKSIWALNKVISIAPDEPNAYDDRAYLYAYSGDIDRAIASFEEALGRNPEFWYSVHGLGHMYLFKGDYANAEKYYRMLVSSDDETQRSNGRMFLAYIPLYQGKLNEALVILDRGISEDQRDGLKIDTYAWKFWLKSVAHLEKKDRDNALSDAREFISACREIAPAEDPYFDDPIIMLLARNKEISEAEALLNSLKDKLEGSGTEDWSWYWLASGWLEMEKANLDTACVHFERANGTMFIFSYSLALAYLEADRLAEAVQMFERALQTYDAVRAGYPIYAVKAYYYLGIAYEKSGSAAKAEEQYERFLEIWKDADPGLEAIRDARERLSRLKAA